ncbi:FimD/PapC N-terminal domain-containing protein, partial [uncultured Pseudomonas sp.]
MMARLAHGEGDYRFDDSLLLGSGLAGGSLERFNRVQQIDPGTYLVDVYVNTHYVNRSEVSFRLQDDAVEPCFSERFLHRHMNARKLETPTADAGQCLALSTRLPGSTFQYDSARLRLDLSVPQALLDIKPRGYVDPQDWDAGGMMGFVNYDASLYNSRYEASASEAAN